MKLTIKVFICFLLTCISNFTYAQNINNKNNVEALENINSSLERIENAITSLTSQNEENAYNQKQAKIEANNTLKDIRLQISEIKEEYNKLSKDYYSQNIAIENLKNIVAMLQEKLTTIEKNTKENTYEPEKQATNNPTNLLVKNSNENTQETTSKISDDEAFKKAMENFNKKDFTESAINFAYNLKTFPESKNFHNNLLYLGLSMKELGNRNASCTAFAKIVNSNEEIEKSIKEVANAGFNELNCNPQKESIKTNNANK